MVDLRVPSGRRDLWLALVFSASLTLLLYGSSLALPLFNDDIANLRLNAGLDLPGLFLRADLLPYYRPLSLVPQEISEILLGHYSAPALHALNLALQITNGWLLWLLARRVAPADPLAAWICATLHLAFPFSYQAIPWIGTLGHLMATSGLLLTLYFADRWWESRHTLHLGLACLGVVSACFSHENGLIVAGLPGLWLLLRFTDPTLASLRANLKRLLLAGLPALGIGMAYLLIWLGVPRNPTEFRPDVATVTSNLAYFSQGLSYPLAQFGGLLERLWLPEWQAAALSSGLGLLLLIGLLLLARQRAAWIGLLIYVIAVLPASLFLAPSYVVDGARLMQMASVGGSLAWGLALSHSLADQRALWRVLGAATLLVLMLGGSLVFIQTRMALHRQLAPLYEQAIEGERPTVLINLPAWLAYRREIYPLGSEGITYYSAYYPFEMLVQFNRGESYPVYVFDRADISPNAPEYYAGLIGPGPTDPPREVTLAGAELVRWTTVIDGQWYWESAERIDGPVEGQRFENGISAALWPRLEEKLLTLQIDWQAEAPVNSAIFVHLVCADQLVAQADGPAMRGMRPFESWQPGEAWRETRLIALPEGIPPESCQVRLGLVDPASGARIPLEGGMEYIESPLAATQPGE